MRHQSTLLFASLILSFPALAATPQVKTVPWNPAGPALPHDTYSGRKITLKGTASTAGEHLRATWNFGDGTQPQTIAVTDRYDLSARHQYFGAPGTVFRAILTVTDITTGESSSAPYLVALREKSLDVEVNIAIDEGLWYLHRTIDDPTAATAASLVAFERKGHLESGDPANPYTETVARALRNLFRQLETSSRRPDSTTSEAIAATGTPQARTAAGRTYQDVLQQLPPASLIPANRAMATDLGRFAASTPRPQLTTAANPARRLLQLALSGTGRPDPRWIQLETALRNRNTLDLDAQSLLDLATAMHSHAPDGIVTPLRYLRSTTTDVQDLDWYSAQLSRGDPADGIARTLIDRQHESGAFLRDGSDETALALRALNVSPAPHINFNTVTNVTPQVTVASVNLNSARQLTITNNGANIPGPVTVVIVNLTCSQCFNAAPVQLLNAAGTFNGAPYVNLSATDLGPGQSAIVLLQFNVSTSGIGVFATNPTFDVVVYSGTFPPAALSVACPANVAQAAVAYSSSLTFAGGVPPYTLSTIGALPTGLILSSSTGAISGTPSIIGPVNFIAKITDSAGPLGQAATANCTITVTGNSKPTASAIPPGLSLLQNAPATGVQLNGADGETAAANLHIAITQPPLNGVLKEGATVLTAGSVLTTGSPANVTYQPNLNFTGADNFQFKVIDRGFPDNCSPGPSCVAPRDSDPVTVPITVRMPDAPNTSVTNITAQVSIATTAGRPALVFVTNTGTTTIPGPITLGVLNPHCANCAPDTVQLLTQAGTFNGDPYLTVILGSLAPGQSNGAVLAFSSPSTSQIFSNIILYDLVVYSGTFPPGPLTVACPSSAAMLGNAYSSSITGNGGVLSYSFSTIGNLPSGLTLNPATGAITGTPLASGTINFTAMVRDSAGRFPQTATQNCTIFVNANNKPTATPTSLTLLEDAAPTPVTLTGTDIETAPANLKITITQAPANGTLREGATTLSAGSILSTGSPATVTYQPNPDFTGADSFRFKTTDRGGPDGCSPSPSCSPALDSDPATVSITVTAVNDQPSFSLTASPNLVVLNNAGPQSIANFATSISAGPADESGQTLTFQFTGNTLPGIFTVAPAISSNGTLTFTPNSSVGGTSTLTVVLKDSGGTANGGVDTSTSRTFTISNNVPPVSTPQSVSTNEDTPLPVTIAAGDVNGDALTYTVVTAPAHGTALPATAPMTCAGIPSACTAIIAYLPAADYNGPDSFTFKTNDGVSDSATVTVSITVNPVNDAPTATPQSVTTVEGAAVAIAIAGTDIETAAANLGPVIFTTPLHGTLSGTPPNMTYTPAAGYFGADSFQIKVIDRGDPDNCSGAPSASCSSVLQSAAATVNITVSPVNTAPTPNPQSVSTNMNVPKAITLSGADTDTSSANLTYTVTQNPQHGTLTGTAPNLTFVPAANYVGPDSFQFVVTDRGKPDNCSPTGPLCAAPLTSPIVANVNITVLAVNTAPIANPQSVTTNQNTAKIIVLAGTDLETAPANLTFANGSPSHGSLTGIAPNLTYTPAPGYFGPDSFTFTVTDRGAPDLCGIPGSFCAAQLTSVAATVSITVAVANTPPTAISQSVNILQDTPRPVTLTGSDLETASFLLFSIAQGPAHGSLTGAAPNLLYSPNTGYTGADSFTFTATDLGSPNNCGLPSATCAAALVSTPGTVSIFVGTGNARPVANSQNVTTTQNIGKIIVLTALDADQPAATLAYTVTVNPAHGVLSGFAPNLTYIPLTNYVGPDTFQFKVTDNLALDSDPATVNISVNGVNTVPTANNQSVVTLVNGSSPITLTGSDAETPAASLTFTVTSPPSHGSLTGPYPNATYTPNAGYIGPDSFQFKVTDLGAPNNCSPVGPLCAAALDSPSATVSITVSVTNTAPTANPQSVTTTEGTAKGITLTGADNETSSANLTYTVTVNPTNGVLSGTGASRTYTPNANYFGTDSFQFTVTDRGAPDNCGLVGPSCTAPITSTAAATVSITVSPVNTAPTATPQTVSTNLNTALPITLSGVDIETTTVNLTYTVTLGPGHGTLTGTGRNLTFTPANNYVGPDTFQFTVTDGGKPTGCSPAGPLCAATITSSAATISINVNAVNTAPTANPQTVNTNEDTALPITLTGTDNESTTFTWQVTLGPTNGTLTGTAPNLTYTPNANYFGPDSFQFKVTDGGAPDGCTPVGPACAATIQSPAAATVSITVNPVNDVPGFAKGPDQNVNEDAVAQTVNPWATSITKGPANESAQNVNFIVSNNNNSLFSLQPAVSPAGVLTYTLAPNVSGTALVSVQIHDDGTTANGGVDTSAVQQFNINVAAVNDPPTFTANTPPTILEDAGAQTVANTATSVSPGPADESVQTVTLSISGNNNAALFSAGPAIDQSGTLTYTPAPNAFGTATITIQAQDTGGTANGGVNTATHTIVITVTGVNDPPTFTTNGNPAAVNEDSGTATVNGFLTSISPGPNESGQNVTFVVTGNTHSVLFSTAPAISPTGTLTYTPAANANGSATITYHAHDDGLTLNGGIDNSGDQTFTITVNAVNDKPVATAKALTAQANMKVVGLSGLLAGATDPDRTNGQADPLSQDAAYTPTFTLNTVAVGGGTPCTNATISNINSAAGSFDFDPPPGFAGNCTLVFTINDSGNPGPAATSDPATITVTVNGPVIWFVDPGAGTNGTGTLNSPFNTLPAATAAMGANTSHRIFVYTGSASGNVTLTGAPTQAIAQWLIGQGVTGTSLDSVMGITPPSGTIGRPSINGTNPTIAGTVTIGATNTSNNVVRGVTITPSSGSSGLVASSSGSGFIVGAATFPAAASDVTISTTSAAAVDLSGGGSGDFIFKSVSANGGSKGIAINNFNASNGSFSVTGTGTTAGSGGTIQNTNTRGAEFISTRAPSLKNMNFTNANLTDGGGAGVCDDTNTTSCNAAIYLSGVSAPVFDRINITGTTREQGINGLNVTGGFTFTNGTIANAGLDGGGGDLPSEEGAIKMRELTGTVTLNNDDFSFSGGQIIEVKNTTGSLLLNVDNSTFRDTQSSANGQGGIQVLTTGTTSVHPAAVVNITNSTFLRLRTHGINVQSVGTTDTGSASSDVDISGNTFDPGTGTMIGIDLDADDASTLLYNIVNNSKVYARNGPAINIFGDVSATVQGRINNNPDVQVKSNSGGSQVGSGIRVNLNKNATGKIEIKNNTVNIGSDDAGIDLSAIGKVTANSGGVTNTLDATVTGNLVTIGPSSTYGVVIVDASNAGDTNATCANVASNTITRNPTSIASFRARVASANGFLRLQGFTTNAESTWNANANTPASSSGSEVSFGGSGTFGSCVAAVPTNPTVN